MGRSLQVAKDKGFFEPDYGIVGELAFGQRFRAFFTFFCATECFFLNVFFLVFISETIGTPLRLPKDLLTAGAATLGVLISLIPKRYVALLSIIGLALTLCCTAAVVGYGFSLQPWNQGQSIYGRDGPVGLVYTVSFVGICVADHPVFPGLYNQAEKSSNYFRGLSVGFLLFTCIAVVLGSCSYLVFGSISQKVILSNLGHDSNDDKMPGLAWLGLTANLFIAFRTLLVLPSFIRPVVGVVQDIVFGVAGWDERSCMSRRTGGRVVLLSVSFALCAGAAILLQDFLSEIEALTGSLFKSINALIIPCLSYLRLCRTRPIERVYITVIIAAASVWGVYGTYDSLRKISTVR
jgi:hypothetical protein